MLGSAGLGDSTKHRVKEDAKQLAREANTQHDVSRRKIMPIAVTQAIFWGTDLDPTWGTRFRAWTLVPGFNGSNYAEDLGRITGHQCRLRRDHL